MTLNFIPPKLGYPPFEKSLPIVRLNSFRDPLANQRVSSSNRPPTSTLSTPNTQRWSLVLILKWQEKKKIIKRQLLKNSQKIKRHYGIDKINFE